MRLFVSSVLLLLSVCSFGQIKSNIPLGAWRTHLPTSSVTTLSILNNKIYTASTVSSFTYDIPDNYLASLSKIDGLTESSITVIRFNATNNLGIIGYSSGNLDIINNGIISNFDVIYRSTITGSKKINNITIYNDVAFIACDFGVAVIDLIKNEIDESWLNLRVGGQPNKVYGCTLNQNKDSVFLATEYGTMSAPYNKPGINLMDFTNWKVYTDISTTQSRAVGQLNGRVYAGISGVGVFVLNGNVWQNIGLSIDATATCWNLVASNNKLLVCADDKVYAIENPSTYTSVLNMSSLRMVQDATYDVYGNLWFADQREGLVKTDGVNYWWISLNGPLSLSTFNLYYYKNTMLANSGGYTNVYVNTYNASGFYEFQNQEKWVSYFRYNSNYPDTLRDNINAFYNPFDDTLYIAHWDYGLVSFKKPNTFVTHDQTNSPLKTNKVTGLDLDPEGNLWIATFGAAQFSPSLYMKSKVGVWSAYTMNTFKTENRFLLQLKIDSVENKWMRYGNNGLPKGLMVYNDKTFQERYFSNTVSDGNLPGDRINCIEVDKKGVVWVGSDQGIAGFYEPSKAFTGSFVAPIYNGFGVLFDKNITCIKTDGGNRKWVGTSEGLWLFNENFSEAIHFFTIDNSPLYSNNILAIEIHAITGEVFIATDKGIISYRSDATEDNEDFSAAKIFPNPVRPGYTGVVTIEGLQDGVMVKVTDMQGKMFYESPTNGGTATWNLTNYAGIKASTGMYLVFATTEDGQEKFVGKIAIVQ